MKKIFIANWKMSLSFKKTLDLTKCLISNIQDLKPNLEIVLCPSFTALNDVSSLLRKSKIQLGAQDCFWEEKGAYTGAISPKTLKEFGCEFVIIGHSEKREYFKETDEEIHKKIKTAINNSLTPIVCVGEKFEERKEGRKDYVVINQITKALEGIILGNQKIIIAYEPVWVIGSGQAVAPEEAEYTNKVIKEKVKDLFPFKIAENNFRFIYGGSVDSRTIKKFFDQPTVDGVLVGGASLDKKEFIKMVKAVE